ncbi:MAG: DUF488 domain-containing protein [Oscillochloris sp.]|nr:DUF488 domain-containing protein [Oscillochloris sp.]
MLTLFTIGYEGLNIELFLERLQAHGITTVIDVRQRPYSRKPDFNKKRLTAHLAAVGINYVHVVELGTPKPLRDAVRRDKDYPAFFAAVTPLIEAEETALAAALERVRSGSCALLCFEHDAGVCHRRVVAEALLHRTAGDLTVVDL